MSVDTDLNNFIINKLTQEQFEGTEKDPNQLYIITDSDMYQKKLLAGKDIVIDQATSTISSTAIPDQTGNLRKFLTTDGEQTYWTLPRINDIFDCKWSDHYLYDIRWLRADPFHWQYASPYITAYNHLIEDGSTQNIAYTFENNILTLKAGSTICIPNGFETENLDLLKKKYITVTLDEDIVISKHSTTDNWEGYLWYDTGGNFSIEQSLVTDESLIPATGVCHFYDKKTNIMKVYSNGTLQDEVSCFPIMRIKSSSIAITDIVEVYNGVKATNYQLDIINGIEIICYVAEDGHKICLPNQENNLIRIFDMTGIAWYYILDTHNKRFKLPRTKYGFNGLRDRVGNSVETKLLHAPEDSLDPIQSATTQMYLYFYVGDFDDEALAQTAGLKAELFNGKADSNEIISRFGNETIGGIKTFTGGVSAYEGGEIHLAPINNDYSYKNGIVDVYGTSIENQGIRLRLTDNAGLTVFADGRATCTSPDQSSNSPEIATTAWIKSLLGNHYVTEFQVPTADNNYTWYRKYADNWVEQGGLYDRGSTSTLFNAIINLPVTMSNNFYTVLVSVDGMAGDHYGEFGCNTEERTSSTFTAYFYTGASADGCQRIFWEVKGIAA